MRNGYPHMVLDAYVQNVRDVHFERRACLDEVTNRAGAEAYQAHIRASIQRAFSPRPAKTPLHTRVTGVLERPGQPGGRAYRVEKLTFESRPGLLVTANLYVPDGLAGPAPCVLGTCGHSEPGKACDLYQGFCQRLAQAGFVVLIYDPFSQGERDSYYGSEFALRGTRAHNMLGKQLELSGEFFGMWRAWDGIRALDVLLERPEVDPTRVGLTGNSGGGTMSTWLWAVDPRFTMAAPSCFVTTFAHNLENELPADAEQCPPGVLGDGLEMADFILAGAPKPVLLMGQHYDYFDRRGLREAYEDVQRFYAVMGAPEGHVGLQIGPQGHGYSSHNQRAMVEFFCRHAGVPLVQVDETEVLDPETLFATPQGQTLAAGSLPAYALSAARARELDAQRSPPDEATLLDELERLLALPSARPRPYHRVLRPVRWAANAEQQGSVLARYAVETEMPIRALLWKRMAQPEHPDSLDVEADLTLYLPHVASEADLSDASIVALCGLDQSPIYALDVRGLGQSLPEEQASGPPGDAFFQPYGMDYMMHAYGLMLGESYLGRRVYDVLVTLDLLCQEGAASVRLVGRGQGAVIALLSALFHERVTELTCVNGPRSWFEWTQTPWVSWPAANCLRGVLAVCDLPDCVRVLRERLGAERMRIVEPWGPAMQTS
jgi:cephalosporin-C deacetylase-like acetyl esterase